MSRRCKSGQRARVICEGPNHRAIVLIERPYFYPQKVSGSVWPRVLRAWVITSLGGPLKSCYLDGRDAPPHQTIVMDDQDLEPLDDDDDGLNDEEDLGKPVDSERPREPATSE